MITSLTDSTGHPLSRAEFARAYAFGGATSVHVQEVDEDVRPHRYLDLSVWDRPTAPTGPAVSEAEQGDAEIGDDEDEVA